MIYYAVRFSVLIVNFGILQPMLTWISTIQFFFAFNTRFNFVRRPERSNRANRAPIDSAPVA